MALRYYVSSEEAPFFVNNKMGSSDRIPTSGTYKVGDFIISNTQANGVFGWVCTQAGTPGTWIEIGTGGSNTKTLSLSSSTVVSSPVREVAIGIKDFNKNTDFLMVYKNSTYLTEGVDYDISSDSTKIVSRTGNWNADSLGDYRFSFVVIKEVEKVNPDAVVGTENIKDSVVTMSKLGEDVIERLDGVDSQLEHITNYNVLNENDFNVNDISITINRLVPMLKSGDTLFVPRGNYSFTETLNFNNLPEGVRIVIDGVLTRKGTFTPAIKINGNGFDFKLYKIIGGDDVRRGIGVQVGGGSCYESYITIKRIENFDIGIEMNPSSNQGRSGIQYNSLNGKLIVDCNKCIFLNLENSSDGWINENAFYDFRLMGTNGIVTNDVGALDGMGYNNNKFYNIGFESLTGDGIDLKFCKGNSFLNCRMLEEINGMYILTNENCNANLFIFSHIIYENRIDLQGKSDRIIAPILNDDGTIISNGFIISANKNKIQEISNETCAIISKDTIVRKHDTSIFLNSYVNPLIITLPQEYSREGFRKVIKVADYKNNITFKDYKGEIVIDEVINSIGYWEILYVNEHWYCYKISYNVEQLPAQYTDANTLEEIGSQLRTLLNNMRSIGLMKK